ncbi:MAG: ABC transporter permease, partial [Fenollaria timonensis]
MLTEISILQLTLSFLFIIVLLVISKIKGLSNQGLIIVASLRMTIQLIITGYLLKYILKSDSPWITVLILIIMEAFAIFNVYKRSKVKSIKLKELIAICFLG